MASQAILDAGDVVRTGTPLADSEGVPYASTSVQDLYVAG